MPNPFEIAGTRRPNTPLDPFTHPWHENLYLPIGGSGEAFERFTAQIGTGHDLLNEGRLVIVTGPDGCGKSTLANRCAAWLHRRLGDEQVRNVVLSLTDVTRPSDSVADRVRIVLQMVVDELEARAVLDRGMLRDLLDRIDEPDRAYRRLRTLLRDTVLLVLLPPSEDLPLELELYAGLAGGSIVFLAESAYTDQVRRQWPAITAASRGLEPILLEVGPADGDDAWLFVRSRLAQYPEGTVPTLSEETIRRVAGARLFSMGQLQTLLHALYAETDFSALSEKFELTYHDITDLYFRLSVP